MFPKRFAVSIIAAPLPLAFAYIAYNAKYNPYLQDDTTSTTTTTPTTFATAPPTLQHHFLERLISKLSGTWVDNIFAYGAGYGRGKLHFKTGGWGDIEIVEKCSDLLKRDALSDRSAKDRAKDARTWVPQDQVKWEGEWTKDQEGAWYRDGSFPTPLIHLFGAEATDKMLFKPAQRCHFRYVVPSLDSPSTQSELFGTTMTAITPTTGTEGIETTPTVAPTSSPLSSSTTQGSGDMPLCIHLPCAGDQFFEWRTRHFAAPLAVKYGIASVIIEAPSYGKRRRPNRQVRGAQIHRVADLAVGGLTQITESIGIFSLFKEHVPCHAKGNFGMCGISMGAEIASLYTAVTPIPTHLVAVMPSHSAVATWNVGVLNEVSDWGHLAATMPAAAGMDSTATASRRTANDARNKARAWLQHTDIRTFPLPYHWIKPKDRPNVLILGALHDAYIPAQSTWTLAEHWNETATCRWLPGGHCTTVVLHKNTIVESIAEVFTSRILPMKR